MLFPIEPGKEASITGNMGELRGNHFHGGLDIRTGYRTGLPVYSSADGYVSFIQISSHGYGYAVHITHPNGLKTVYAHLERFQEDLAAVIQNEQRNQDAFEIDYNPPAGLYKVKRGDIIGWSGNSGSSGGPHLHYEIRDTNDLVLNPMHFGFKEVRDRLAPYVSGLYARSFGISSRVNGEFGLHRLAVKAISKNLYQASPIRVQGTFGFEIMARDRINNGTQHTGISCMELRIDGREVYSANLERFFFENSGHINAHIDYELFKNSGERFQKVYTDDGYSPTLSQPGADRGFLYEAHEGTHRYEIICYDAYGNTCKVQGTYTLDTAPLFTAARSSAASKLDFKVSENIMEIAASGPSPLVDSMGVWVHDQFFSLKPRYQRGVKNYYLFDMRIGLPDSFGSLAYREKTNLVGTITCGGDCKASSATWCVNFRPRSLFDTCYLPIVGSPQDRDFEIGNPAQPLSSFIDIKALFPTPLHPKESFYLLSGGHTKWLRTSARGDSVAFQTKYFGRFKILKDSTPPLARLVQANRNGFRAIIRDNLSGIRDFHVYLNDKPLATEYDHKRDLVWVTARELDVAGPGKLEFVVTDNCGNEKRLRASIL